MIILIRGCEVYYNITNKDSVLNNIGVNQSIYDMITRGNLEQAICNVVAVKVRKTVPLTKAFLRYLVEEIKDTMLSISKEQNIGDIPLVIMADPLIFCYHDEKKFTMYDALKENDFVNVYLDGSLRGSSNTNIMIYNDDAGKLLIQQLLDKKVIVKNLKS